MQRNCKTNREQIRRTTQTAGEGGGSGPEWVSSNSANTPGTCVHRSPGFSGGSLNYRDCSLGAIIATEFSTSNDFQRECPVMTISVIANASQGVSRIQRADGRRGSRTISESRDFCGECRTNSILVLGAPFTGALHFLRKPWPNREKSRRFGRASGITWHAISQHNTEFT